MVNQVFDVNSCQEVYDVFFSFADAALAVDLTGQIDFIRGTARSEGGKPIIALSFAVEFNGALESP